MWRTVSLLLLGLTGCCASGDLATTRDQGEGLAGRRVALRVETCFGGVVRDAEAEARMQEAAERLARSNPDLRRTYHCLLLASDEPNAISVPGGRIYVTCGLYGRLESDEHLAAVLAHEMGHFTENDHYKQRCRSSRESLDRERTADGLAVRYLHAAGYPASAMAELIELIADAQPEGWVSARQAMIARECSAVRSTASMAARADRFATASSDASLTGRRPVAD